MGRAEELFVRIKDGGAAEIDAMINAPVVEELFDYKRSSTVLPGVRLSDDDRKNLAKAIAGFANSEGGVVVWGVDRRHTDEGDVPTGPVPIGAPLALKTLFDGAIGGLTLPAHSGVENFAALDGTGKGFVITHVPTGLNVPYQTLYPKQQYYIRAGSAFQPTPHSVLAGMFGRVPQPDVVPLVAFRDGQATENNTALLLSFLVTFINKGRGLAEDIFCTLEHALPDGCSLVTYRQGYEREWSNVRDGRTCTTIVIGKEAMLPPGAELQVMTLKLYVNGTGKGDLSFSLAVGSRNGPGAAQTVLIPGQVVDDLYKHYNHRYVSEDARKAAEPGYLRPLLDCLLAQRV
jgi:hypothetical protein